MKTAEDAFRRIAKALAGAPVSHVWCGYGSALFIECGALTEGQSIRRDGSRTNPRGRWTIGMDFDWRIEGGCRILCGSRDDEADREGVLSSLIGDEIARVEVFGEVPELCVTLKSDRQLVTFALDVAGPEWTLSENAAPPVWVYWHEGTMRADDGQVRRR